MSTEKEIKNEATVVASAEQTANAEVQTPKKRRGRGINNDLRDVTRKKFDERTDCNKANGLFIGHLEDVKVDWATLKDDVQGMPSFAGMSIPYLTFTFASNHENINERRYVTQRLLPAESNVETIPGGKGAWKVDNIFRFMKHIYNVFVLKGRDLTEEEIDAMNEVKAMGIKLSELVEKLENNKDLDQRWIESGKTDLQKGLMALTRSIARPEFF
jgi:hypothetical protein